MINCVSLNVNASDKTIIAAVLLNDDSILIYQGTLPTNLILTKHFNPLECLEINSNELDGTCEENGTSNRLKSQAGNVHAIAFTSDSSELWVTDAASKVTIIEAHQWQVKDQIHIDNRYVREIICLSERCHRRVLKEKISICCLGLTNRNELILLYQNNEDNQKNYEVITLNEPAMARAIRLSNDGQRIAIRFENGKLHLYSTEIMLSKLLNKKFEALNTTGGYTEIEQTKRVRMFFYGKRFVELFAVSNPFKLCC